VQHCCSTSNLERLDDARRPLAWLWGPAGCVRQILNDVVTIVILRIRGVPGSWAGSPLVQGQWLRQEI
jgi:hypothetical protein